MLRRVVDSCDLEGEFWRLEGRNGRNDTTNALQSISFEVYFLSTFLDSQIYF